MEEYADPRYPVDTCRMVLAYLTEWDGSNTYSISSWSQSQEDLFNYLRLFYDFQQLYNDNKQYAPESVTKVFIAVRYMERLCGQKKMPVSDVVGFELYMIAKHPETYYQWIFDPEFHIRAIMNNLYDNQSDYFQQYDQYFLARGNFKYAIDMYNLMHEAPAPVANQQSRKRRNSARATNPKVQFGAIRHRLDDEDEDDY
jgi:hypothetical protein